MNIPTKNSALKLSELISRNAINSNDQGIVTLDSLQTNNVTTLRLGICVPESFTVNETFELMIGFPPGIKPYQLGDTGFFTLAPLKSNNFSYPTVCGPEDGGNDFYGDHYMVAWNTNTGTSKHSGEKLYFEIEHVLTGLEPATTKEFYLSISGVDSSNGDSWLVVKAPGITTKA